MAGALSIRTREELEAELPEGQRRAFSGHCKRLSKVLHGDERVGAVAVCRSGNPGLLAVTDERILFVNKPAGQIALQALEFKLNDIAEGLGLAATQLNILRAGSSKPIGFHELEPPIAMEMAELLWRQGVARPAGMADPELPPVCLPTRAFADLQAVLRPEDQSPCEHLNRRVVELLGETEEVLVVASCQSKKRGVLALTDERLLFVTPTDAAPEALPIAVRVVVSAIAPHGASLKLKLHSSNLPAADFTEMRPALAKAFAEQLRRSGADDPATLAGLAEAGRPDQSALSVLPSKTAKVLKGSIGPQDTVFLCLVGGFGQALIALGDRVLIAKAGLMSGNTFGGKVTAFPYREITGVEIHTGFSTGVLAIQTASFSGTQAGTYWSKGKNANPAELPNAIPLPNKQVVAKWQPHLELLRRGVSAGGLVPAAKKTPLGEPVFLKPIAAESLTAPVHTSTAATGGIADEVAKLAALRDAGGLTDEEFAQAKARLLG
jgi:hypothetical protein